MSAILVVGAIAVTACSSSNSNANSTSSMPSMYASAHNSADITFATDMIPHHGQAIQMADMALQKGSNGTVRSLATQIQGAQDPEIKQMSTMLTGWGAPVPSTSSMPGMSMGSSSSMPGMDMNGMMSSQQMAQLDAASGAAFDKLWVQMMIQHHQGAVTMAKAELNSGQSPDAKKLAQAIITGQTREIATMQGLLGRLG